MKWATRAMIHFDRVAAAWLILRFIDRDAQFTFLAEGESAEDGTIVFGIAGVQLAGHGAGDTTFGRILAAYSLDDDALRRIDSVVAAVVEHVMQDPDRSALATRNPHVAGLLAVAEGMMLLSATDMECLTCSLPVYDALYARLQAQIAVEQSRGCESTTVLEETLRFSRAVSAIRASQHPFSLERFGNAL